MNINMNKFVLGTAQFGIPYGINNRIGIPNEQDIAALLDSAYDQGIQKLDTASAYGYAQKNIGQFHRSCNKRFKVYSKVTIDQLFDKNFLSNILNECLIESLEGLAIHNLSTKLSSIEMKQLKKLADGVSIKKLGCTVYTLAEFQFALDQKIFKYIQIPFNVFDSKEEKIEMMNKANSQDIFIQVRSIFLQGLYMISPQNLPPNLNLFSKPLEKINHLSQMNNLSLHEVILRYCLSFDQIAEILFGLESREQLSLNITAIKKGPLDNSLLESLREIILPKELIPLLNPSRWT
jgi:aryl-alcohol dehydrogenase-like predicted oxidoreductase